MDDSLRLAHRLREVILNGKWIANTNIKDQIKDVSLEQALKQVADLNTIASLTFHINYYISGVLQVLEGGDLDISDKFSFDLPAIKFENEWTDLKTELFKNTEQFAQRVESMSNEQLNAVFIKEEYGDFKRNIEAMIEHSYYHLGQVTLIKKMIFQPLASMINPSIQ